MGKLDGKVAVITYGFVDTRLTREREEEGQRHSLDTAEDFKDNGD